MGSRVVRHGEDLITARRSVAAAAAIIAIELVTIANPVAACPAPHHFVLQVTGYAEDGTAASLIDADAPALHTLGVDGVNIDTAGDQVPMPGKESLALLQQAHRHHLEAEFLIGKYLAAIGDFDPAATSA